MMIYLQKKTRHLKQIIYVNKEQILVFIICLFLFFNFVILDACLFASCCFFHRNLAKETSVSYPQPFNIFFSSMSASLALISWKQILITPNKPFCRLALQVKHYRKHMESLPHLLERKANNTFKTWQCFSIRKVHST